jgi:hypothetical protein
MNDIELSPHRSWTPRTGRSAGVEPDECYILGAEQDKPLPDLAIRAALRGE